MILLIWSQGIFLHIKCFALAFPVSRSVFLGNSEHLNKAFTVYKGVLVGPSRRFDFAKHASLAEGVAGLPNWASCRFYTT